MSIGIWNNIDELALFLGLSRLDGESNDELTERVKIFPKWKYKTDYYTQVHSIPLQLGLQTTQAIYLDCISGNKFECIIDWDYMTVRELGGKEEYIRIFLEGKDSVFQDILNAFNLSKSFHVIEADGFNINTPIKFLVRNRNTKFATAKSSGKYSYLEHKNILNGSVSIDNKSYRKLVNSITAIKRPGDYFIDYEGGFIQTFDNDPEETVISYTYFDPTFALETTELNLIPVNRYFAYGMSDDAINKIPYLLNNLVAGE